MGADQDTGLAARTSMLCLVDGPSVVQSRQRIIVPPGSQRLLVLVALHGGPVERRTAASTLWPDCVDARAGGNLRSALWRLRGAGLDLIDARHGFVALGHCVDVDVHAVTTWAERLVRGTYTDDDLVLSGRRLDPDDVLPGWQDPWVVAERERLRHRVLHGLEALSEILRGRGRFAEAVEAALWAVQLEPLRESAQKALLLGHLAQGNRVEARRVADNYVQLLLLELGSRGGATDIGDLLEGREPWPTTAQASRKPSTTSSRTTGR